MALVRERVGGRAAWLPLLVSAVCSETSGFCKEAKGAEGATKASRKETEEACCEMISAIGESEIVVISSFDFWIPASRKSRSKGIFWASEEETEESCEIPEEAESPEGSVIFDELAVFENPDVLEEAVGEGDSFRSVSSRISSGSRASEGSPSKVSSEASIEESGSRSNVSSETGGGGAA